MKKKEKLREDVRTKTINEVLEIIDKIEKVYPVGTGYVLVEELKAQLEEKK